MPSPDVTVVVPAHGPGPYLDAALESALAEAPAELIVVEDGTEGVDVAGRAGVRLIRLERVGRSRARNRGVEAARTPYVAFLDEDDLCLPGRLERQRAALDAAPGAVMTFGLVTVVDASGRALAELNREFAPRFRRLVASGPSYAAIVELGGPLYTSATLVRRDAFLDSGGFDAAFDAYEDLDLYLRLAREGAFVATAGPPVSGYRIHPANTRSDDLYRALVALTDKHLPAARGRDRAALLEKRVDALWGLGAFGAARSAATAAVRTEPSLLLRRVFLKRAAGLALPRRLLEARR